METETILLVKHCLTYRKISWMFCERGHYVQLQGLATQCSGWESQGVDVGEEGVAGIEEVAIDSTPHSSIGKITSILGLGRQRPPVKLPDCKQER